MIFVFNEISAFMMKNVFIHCGSILCLLTFSTKLISHSKEEAISTRSSEKFCLIFKTMQRKEGTLRMKWPVTLMIFWIRTRGNAKVT